jgi:uncharacterized membrane protein YccC
MSTPTPVTPPPPVGLAPSASTVGTGVGVTVASVIIYLLGLKGIFLPAGSEALIAGFVGMLAGYLPKAGRI